MSSFPHDPDDGTSIEFQNWWTAKRAEIETLPPIDLYEALKKAAFSKERVMGPGMFDDVPKMLGCLAVAILLIGIFLGAALAYAMF